jgi:hypothetical protein
MPEVREASSRGEPYIAGPDNSNVKSHAHRPPHPYSNSLQIVGLVSGVTVRRSLSAAMTYF